MKNILYNLKEQIEKAESIIIFSHVNADGDTLGSNLALSLMIEKLFNKKVVSAYVGYLPKTYSYLPSYNNFVDAKAIDENKVFDLAIAVDVAAKDRMTYGTRIFDNAKVKANIDHHKTNISYGDINIIDGDAACVGIILYKIFKEWNAELTLDIAKCIYTSLMTDTGCFKYETTTPEVFRLAAELVELGVVPIKEYRACYESKPLNMVQFQAHIVNNAIYHNNGQIAIAKITKDDMTRFNATDDFTEGIVETIRSAQCVEISALLKENSEGNTKVSLRSKTVDLAPIVKVFNGGGHTFAAGCTINRPINIAYEKLLEAIQCTLK